MARAGILVPAASAHAEAPANDPFSAARGHLRGRVPTRGRAVTLGKLRATAKRDGRLRGTIKLTRAGGKALRRGRLENKVRGRCCSDRPVSPTRRVAYKP
jgi:hypothetical protein